jgi:hypothetical protein
MEQEGLSEMPKERFGKNFSHTPWDRNFLKVKCDLLRQNYISQLIEI